jgi:serine protease AprX
MRVTAGIGVRAELERIFNHRLRVAVVMTLLAAVAASFVINPADRSDDALVGVIVRKAAGAGTTPEQLVDAVGGKVGQRLGIINGFSAQVPAGAVDRLAATAGVADVSRNKPVTLMGTWDGVDVLNRMSTVIETVKADEAWEDGYTGKGVGVAVLDSGVAPVAGLNGSGKVVNGPDLTWESQSANLRYLDTFGHGTAMAGIIAGRDAAATKTDESTAQANFMGIAPDAKIISVKAADATGASDISQILAGIDWIVQHRNDSGLNIKVLNLSFGTDSEQDYKVDPLTYATEVAWRAGITVVVSAGNTGFGSAKLNNPAYDPFVIAVGSADIKGTVDNDDDTASTFSSAGDKNRKPDFMAPGQAIASLRVPGSMLDTTYPGARKGTRFFRGSGTSQAAAVISGVAALMIQKYPSATPDQIKKLLDAGTDDSAADDTEQSGAGIIDMDEVLVETLPTTTAAAQGFSRSTGTGKLDLSRGSGRLTDGKTTLSGEKDIFGKSFSSSSWASKAGKSAWSGGSWNGTTWSGSSFSGSNWSTATWTGTTWGGTSWTSGLSTRHWTTSGWTSGGWTTRHWTSGSWESNSWSSAGWK